MHCKQCVDQQHRSECPLQLKISPKLFCLYLLTNTWIRGSPPHIGTFYFVPALRFVCLVTIPAEHTGHYTAFPQCGRSPWALFQSVWSSPWSQKVLGAYLEWAWYGGHKPGTSFPPTLLLSVKPFKKKEKLCVKSESELESSKDLPWTKRICLWFLPLTMCPLRRA